MGEILQIKPRWQVTIPKSARDALRVQEGDYLVAEVENSAIVLRPVRTKKLIPRFHPASSLDAMSGIVAIGGNAVEDCKKLYR